jgi:hypothetical protein
MTRFLFAELSGHYPWQLPGEPWQLPGEPWQLPGEPWQLPEEPWQLPEEPWQLPGGFSAMSDGRKKYVA